MRARINNQDIYNLSCKLDLLSERIEKEMTHSKQKMENLKVRVANLEDKLSEEKKVYTTQEAANYIGVSVYKLYQLVKSSQIAFSKPNRKIFFYRHELDEWLSINKINNILYGNKNHIRKFQIDMGKYSHQGNR